VVRSDDIFIIAIVAIFFGMIAWGVLKRGGDKGGE
jgi:hypothetical protein